MAEAGGSESTTGATEKNPAEQESLARTLGSDLTELFLHFVHGEMSFADLTFETYETLQDLYIIASGDYELEYDDSAEYEVDEATAEQEELAQEPAGPDND
jgi:hypothetical protein